MSNLYGYGIVDKDGNPWFDEDCICEDKAPLEETADYLNSEKEIIEFDDNGKFIDPPNYNPPAPYRVVTLYWVDSNAAQAEEGYPQ